MKNDYLFILGQAEELAAAELESVWESNFGPAVLNVTKNLARIKSEIDSDQIIKLMGTLGGTIKIGRLVGKGEYHQIIKQDLQQRPVRDVGFSFYGSVLPINDRHPELDSELALNSIQGSKQSNGFLIKSGMTYREELINFKLQLKADNIKIRLVIAKNENVLNAAEVVNNRLLTKGREYLILPDQVYETIAVQPIEEFNRRDFDKPVADAESGMLPPKLARMMVNLAVNQIRPVENNQDTRNKIQTITNNQTPIFKQGTKNVERDTGNLTVIDPFCGSGNLLIEALDLGYHIAGSDLSDKAVQGTIENLNWFLKIRNSKSEIPYKSEIQNLKTQNTTASHLAGVRSGHLRGVGQSTINDQQLSTCIQQLDATKDDFLSLPAPYRLTTDNRRLTVTTELDLGHPYHNPLDKSQLDADVSRLSELYCKFLKNLKRLMELKDRKIGAVVLVFPKFTLQGGGSFSLFDHLIDRIEKIGYISSIGPFDYGRSYQIVKREIVLLSFRK